MVPGVRFFSYITMPLKDSSDMEPSLCRDLLAGGESSGSWRLLFWPEDDVPCSIGGWRGSFSGDVRSSAALFGGGGGGVVEGATGGGGGGGRGGAAGRISSGRGAVG